MTDELRVRQIIMNGLTNAIKYSNAPANGPIQVVARICSKPVVVLPESTVVLATANYTGGVTPLRQLLCIDVLARGPGLCGIDESVLFVDFAAPVIDSSHGTAMVLTTGSTITNRVGSSGVQFVGGVPARACSCRCQGALL
jgi:hypothetical protein